MPEGRQDPAAHAEVGHVVYQLPPGQDAQDQHRQHRPDGAQGHQAEAVFLAPPVAQNAGNAHAQGHKEGHRNGPRGHAAGIEGHRQHGELPPHRQQQRHRQNGKGEQGEEQHVKQHQNLGQRPLEYDLQNRRHQKRAHADAHGVGQDRAVDDGPDLPRQHL